MSTGPKSSFVVHSLPHGAWSRTFEDFRARRQRELEQFEERQRVVLERFEEELRQLAQREKAPGAAAKRKGFFSF